MTVSIWRLVRQEVLTNTCTNVASGFANVAGITASTWKFIKRHANVDLVVLIFPAEYMYVSKFERAKDQLNI